MKKLQKVKNVNVIELGRFEIESGISLHIQKSFLSATNSSFANFALNT